jgi:wyosine [tRNA(Phe)-imidazoG37] synthetase (radical SAM superfamily)
MAPLNLDKIARTDLAEISSVYGPVRSWRVGLSLGVDLLCLNSICSFNCTYCQLGFIQVQVNERQLFVPTEKVLSDLRASDWQRSDIVTFSGSGEPTLAANLGEALEGVKRISRKPVLVLTNGTLLDQSDVQEELIGADRVYLKLDAATEKTLRRVNRPVSGVTLERIVEGASRFREKYSGILGIQMMFVYSNLKDVDRAAEILNRIQPDEVQINTPTRPYPRDWYLQSRGSHEGVDYPAKPLKPVSRTELDAIVKRLGELTGRPKILFVHGKDSRQ